MSIRVVVSDDHPITRAGTVAILQRDKNLQVVGEAADGPETIAVCRETQPDLVLLDVQLPMISGIVVAKRLKVMADPPRILMLSGFSDGALVRSALAAGAISYALKSLAPHDLLAKIYEVMRMPQGLEGVRKDTPLSAQEMIVLCYVAKSLTTTQIGQQMSSSTASVESHLARIYVKLGAQTRSEAVMIAQRNGLLAEE